MNDTAPSVPPSSKPSGSGVRLLLKLVAVAAAGGAQAYVFQRPWLSVAGFAFGSVLFLAIERGTAPPPDASEQPVPPASTGLWTLFAIGCALCTAAGILVYRQAPPIVTHPTWLLGLLCFAAGAFLSRPRGRTRQRPSRRTLVTVLLLLVLAGAFFGWQVARIPPEVHGDEGEVGMDAVELMTQQPFNLFTVGWYWLPRLHVLRHAAAMQVLGVNLLGLRITSVMLGAAAVLLIFGVGCQLWGFEVGVLAGLLLVSARFFIYLSRNGLHYIDTPVFSILVAYLAWRTWRELRLDLAIVCGLVLGLGIQTYYASRLVPVLLTLTWLLWFAGSHRRHWLRRGQCFALIAVIALATAAPMAGYFWRHPADLWMRTIETSAFGAGGYEHLAFGYGTHDLRYILLVQLQHAVTLFNYTSDSSLQYGYSPGGMFEPVCATLFALGIAAACAHPLWPRNLLLLLWIGLPVVAGGALTVDTPFYPRIAGVVPFAVLAAALASHSVLSSVREVLPRSVARVAPSVLALGVLAVVFSNNIRDYFFDYAPHHRHAPGVEIAAWIRSHGAGKTTYMIGGNNFFIKHGTIRFLSYGYATQDVINLDVTLQGSRFDPATSLFIIMPQGKELIPKLQAAVGPLQVEPQRYLDNPAAFYTAIPLGATPEQRRVAPAAPTPTRAQPTGRPTA